MVSLLELRGMASVTTFTAGLEFIIGRHDVLRTAVIWKG